MINSKFGCRRVISKQDTELTILWYVNICFNKQVKVLFQADFVVCLFV